MCWCFTQVACHIFLLLVLLLFAAVALVVVDREFWSPFDAANALSFQLFNTMLQLLHLVIGATILLDALLT